MDLRKICIFFVAVCLLSVGCAKKKLEKYSEMKSLFGTQIRIDVCADPAKTQQTARALARVWQRLEEIQKDPQVASQLTSDQARLKISSVKIESGRLAVGYGVNHAVGFLREFGFKSFLIDATGDIYAGGGNCQGNPWRIGIKDTRNRAKILDVVLLSDKAVATLGQAERSVTVIAPKPQDASILAAAFNALPAAQVTNLIDSLGKSYAIAYKEEEKGARLKSKAYADYQIKY